MNTAAPPRAAQASPRQSAFNPISVIALIIAAVLLVVAGLEGRKLQPDFQYPTTTATVTDYTVNVYANVIMATIAGPIEIVATGRFSVSGETYTFTGQFRRLVNPGDVDPTTRNLIGSSHQVWYDPTNPQVAAFYPLGAAQIGLYAGGGWIALMIGLAPIVLNIKSARSARATAAIRSEAGVVADTDYQKAVALYDQKQYRPALAQFDKVLKKGGGTVEVHRFRARAYYALGELDGAIKAISAGITVEPHDQTLYLQRTKLYLKQGDREAAVRDLTRAIELRKDDDDFDLYMQRGRIFEEWNRLEDALNDYATGLKMRPDAHELHLHMAQILEKRQLYRDALEEYEAYLYSGAADVRGDAAQIEAKIKQMYAKAWR